MNTAATWTSTIKQATENGLPAYLDSQGHLIEGIYLGLDNDTYHQLPAYSSSQIKVLIKETPAHFYAKFIEKTNTSSQSKSMELGTIAHKCVLEYQSFLVDHYRVPTPKDYPNALLTADDLRRALTDRCLGTSGNKENLIKRLVSADPSVEIFDVIKDREIAKQIGLAAFNKALDLVAQKSAKDIDQALLHKDVLSIKNRKPINGDLWDKSAEINDSVRSHKTARKLLKGGMSEVTIIARCEITGLMLKAKLDLLNEAGFAIDFKTTKSAHPSCFAKQAKELRYDIQEAFYRYVARLAGLELLSFGFIATEHNEVTITEVYELKPSVIERAVADMETGLKLLSECLDKDDWFGYSRHEQVMVLDL